MFPDIGGTELLIVAVITLLVVKPKDLPMMMRRFGEFMNKARRMASDFRASFDDMARQSELDDLRREVEAMRSKASDPLGVNSVLHETTAEIQSGLTDPDFNYGYTPSMDVDNSVEWDGSGFVPAPEPAVEPAPKAKAAPKRRAAEPGAEPKPARASKTTPKSRATKPIVEPAVSPAPKRAPKAQTLAAAKPKRAPASRKKAT